MNEFRTIEEARRLAEQWLWTYNCAEHLADVKLDEEYTEEEIQAIWDEQVRIDKENAHKRKHAKLQTLLDVCVAEYEKGGSDSH